MDFSGDHRCEVYCAGENSLAHPSTAMWLLSAVTRQWMACSECLPELSGTLISSCHSRNLGGWLGVVAHTFNPSIREDLC